MKEHTINIVHGMLGASYEMSLQVFTHPSNSTKLHCGRNECKLMKNVVNYHFAPTEL